MELKMHINALHIKHVLSNSGKEAAELRACFDAERLLCFLFQDAMATSHIPSNKYQLSKLILVIVVA